MATTASMGQVAYPSMKRFGYSDTLSTGSIMAGGTLGILTPPSVVLLVYGILTPGLRSRQAAHRTIPALPFPPPVGAAQPCRSNSQEISMRTLAAVATAQKGTATRNMWIQPAAGQHLMACRH